MSARVKKNLFIWVAITISAACGILLFMGTRGMLRAQQQDVEGEANFELQPGETRVISSTTTELVSERTGWKRVHETEKEIEFIDPVTEQVVRDVVKSKIAEVGSGLNFWDENQAAWLPSNPHFVAVRGGFELVECGYKVSFGTSLTDVMTQEIDGVAIPMKLEYIVVSDGTNQTTLAPAQNVTGHIDENDPSVLHFTGAFNNIDVTYRAFKGGFHQDVKLKDVDALKFQGINAEAAKVYVYTSIDNSDFAGDRVSTRINADEEINTGLAVVNTRTLDDEQLVFSRTVDNEDKQLFLFDKSPVLDASGEEVAFAGRQLWKNQTTNKLYLVESVALDSLDDGSVIDYQTWSGSITDPTVWTSDPDYYHVTDDIALSDELVIEPGTVIRMASDTSINVNSGGKIIARGEPYNYILFTGFSGAYDEAININGGSSDSVISYCKIKNANVGIQIQNCCMGAAISNNIISDCGIGIRCYNNSGNDFVNNLIYDCTSYGVVTYGWEGPYGFYSNTIDSCGRGIYILGDPDPESNTPAVTVKDSIITNWTTNGIYNSGGTVTAEYTHYYPDSNFASGFSPSTQCVALASSPYASSCATGDYYLSDAYVSFVGDGSSRGSFTAGARGFTNDIFTYKAPTPVTGTITTETTWSDGDGEATSPGYSAESTVLRGYHHNRINKLLSSDVTFGGSTSFDFTIEPGVVVAYSGNGTDLFVNGNAYGQCKLIANGEADNPIIFTNARVVSTNIEYYAIGYDAQVALKILELSDDSGAEISNAIFQGLQYGILEGNKVPEFCITDCLFRHNSCGIWTRYFGSEQTFTNCVFYDNGKGVWYSAAGQFTPNERVFRNLTFYKNVRGISINPSDTQDQVVTVKDCLFVGNDDGIKRENTYGVFEEEYNAYYDNDKDIEDSVGGSIAIDGDSLSLGSDPFDDSWKTNWVWSNQWFLDQAGDCVNGGSTDAYTSRMSKHTTDGDDYYTDTGFLDIGYHYWVFDDTGDTDDMNDHWEAESANNADDADADPDDDGLDNLEEYEAGTNPHDPDTDGDSLSDGFEVAYSAFGDKLSPLAVDSNGNGIPDGEEDPDEDGLTNEQEEEMNTDPKNPDTNGNGILDGSEPEPTDEFAIFPMSPEPNNKNNPQLLTEPVVAVRGCANRPLSKVTIKVSTGNNNEGYAAIVSGKTFENVAVPIANTTGEYQITVAAEDREGNKITKTTWVVINEDVPSADLYARKPRQDQKPNSPYRNVYGTHELDPKALLSVTATEGTISDISAKINGYPAACEAEGVFTAVQMPYVDDQHPELGRNKIMLKRGSNLIRFTVKFKWTKEVEDDDDIVKYYTLSRSVPCFFHVSGGLKSDEFSSEKYEAEDGGEGYYEFTRLFQYRNPAWFFEESATPEKYWVVDSTPTNSRYMIDVLYGDPIVTDSEGEWQPLPAYEMTSMRTSDYVESHNHLQDPQSNYDHKYIRYTPAVQFRTYPVMGRDESAYLVSSASILPAWGTWDAGYAIEGVHPFGTPPNAWANLDLPTDQDFSPSISASYHTQGVPPAEVTYEGRDWTGINANPIPYYLIFRAEQVFGNQGSQALSWTNPAYPKSSLTVRAYPGPEGGAITWDDYQGTLNNYSCAYTPGVGGTYTWRASYKYPATNPRSVADEIFVPVLADGTNLFTDVPKRVLTANEGMPVYAKVVEFECDHEGDPVGYQNFSPASYTLDWHIERVGEGLLHYEVVDWRSTTTKPDGSGNVSTAWHTASFKLQNGAEVTADETVKVWAELHVGENTTTSPEYEILVKCGTQVKLTVPDRLFERNEETIEGEEPEECTHFCAVGVPGPGTYTWQCAGGVFDGNGNGIFGEYGDNIKTVVGEETTCTVPFKATDLGEWEVRVSYRTNDGYASDSETVYVVGVEILDHDEKEYVGAGTDITLNAWPHSPEGGTIEWQLPAGDYEIVGGSENAPQITFRFKTGGNKSVNVQYTFSAGGDGPVTVNAMRRNSEGTYVSDAAEFDSLSVELTVPEPIMERGVPTTAPTHLHATAYPGTGTYRFSSVSGVFDSDGDGEWNELGDDEVFVDIGNECYIRYLPLIPGDTTITVSYIYDEGLQVPDGKDVTIVGVEIAGHNDPVYCAVGQPIELSANTYDLSPYDVDFQWAIPGIQDQDYVIDSGTLASQEMTIRLIKPQQEDWVVDVAVSYDTLTVDSNRYNQDYEFVSDEAEFTTILLDICQDSMLNVITDTTHDEIIGKKINLIAVADVPGCAWDEPMWEIPGVKVKDFVIDSIAHTGTPSEFTTEDHQGYTPSFYWADQGEEREVAFSVRVSGNGHSPNVCTAGAIFNVGGPTASIVLDAQQGIGTVGVFFLPQWSRWELMLTKIDWDKSVDNGTVPYGFGNGELQYIQIILESECYRRSRAPGNDWEVLDVTSDGPVCDGLTPKATSQDSPGLSLVDIDMAYVQGTAPGEVPRKPEKFQVYLVFRPDAQDAQTGRIWVPLHRMTWSWAGHALDEEDEWDAADIVPADSIVPNPAFDVPADFDQWPKWVNDVDLLKDNWVPYN